MQQHRKRIRNPVLQRRDLGDPCGEHALHRDEQCRRIYLRRRQLGASERYRGSRRRMQRHGQRIWIPVLQRYKLDHTGYRNRVHRERYRCRLHLLLRFLGAQQYDSNRRQRLYRHRQRIGLTLLQWGILDYTRCRNSLYRNQHGGRLHLLFGFLDVGQRNCCRRRRLRWHRQRIGIALLQRRHLDHTGSRYGLYRRQHSGRLYLQFRLLDHGHRYRSSGWGMQWRRQRIRLALLQRHDVEYTRGGNSVHRNRYSCRLYLHFRCLGEPKRHAGRGRSMHRNRKCIWHALLQWRDLDYTSCRDGLYRDQHRLWIHLHCRRLGDNDHRRGFRRCVQQCGQRIRFALL